MKIIFEESSLAGIKLKNRIFRSPTHEGLSDVNGYPLEDALTQLYTKLALGGVGAIITGYVAIQKNGKTFSNMRMFDEDKYIDIYKRITTSTKELGTPIIQQIAHGGGMSSTRVTGEKVVAPSKKLYPISFSLAEKLTEDQIIEIKNNFIEAIVRTKKAGFDGVQLNAAHGALLFAFFSPSLNKRNDGWGGNTEKRFRLFKEILQGARDKVDNYPILVKFSAYDYARNGMRIEEAIRISELFQQNGIDAIEISSGGAIDSFNTVRVDKIPIEASLKLAPVYKNLPQVFKSIFRLTGPLLVKKYHPYLNYNVNAAQAIKKHVNIPVIVVGGIRNIDDMESIVAENKADYVSMCRPFILEPDLVNKMHKGKQKESRCINCGICLLNVMENPLKCFYGKV